MIIDEFGSSCRRLLFPSLRSIVFDWNVNLTIDGQFIWLLIMQLQPKGSEYKTYFFLTNCLCTHVLVAMSLERLTSQPLGAIH